MFRAKPDFFRVEQVTSHHGEAGVEAGVIAPLAEFFNRQADVLATDGAALRAVPPSVLDDAEPSRPTSAASTKRTMKTRFVSAWE